jgi:hypothetical protein
MIRALCFFAAVVSSVRIGDTAGTTKAADQKIKLTYAGVATLNEALIDEAEKITEDALKKSVQGEAYHPFPMFVESKSDADKLAELNKAETKNADAIKKLQEKMNAAKDEHDKKEHEVTESDWVEREKAMEGLLDAVKAYVEAQSRSDDDAKKAAKTKVDEELAKVKVFSAKTAIPSSSWTMWIIIGVSLLVVAGAVVVYCLVAKKN